MAGEWKISRKHRYFPLRNKSSEWLRRCYQAHAYSMAGAGRACGVDRDTFGRELDRRGIARREPECRRNRLRGYSTAELLRLVDANQGVGGWAAKVLGVSRATFALEMFRRTGKHQRYGWRHVNWKKEALEDLYHRQGMTIQQIADHYGVTFAPTQRAMARLGVKTRPIMRWDSAQAKAAAAISNGKRRAATLPLTCRQDGVSSWV